MRAFLATVLSLIAAGVLLIAYGLLSPRAAAAPGDVVSFDPAAAPSQGARPFYASERVPVVDPRYAPAPYAYAPTAGSAYARPAYFTQTAPSPRHVVVAARGSRRDWKKTALVIGGSSAAGAGIGGLLGGGKGAAIGAAIGGGASTLFEALR